MQTRDVFAGLVEDDYNPKIPGKGPILSDTKEMVNKRYWAVFNSDNNLYTPDRQALIRISSSDSFLDVDNSYLQCEINLTADEVGGNTDLTRIPPSPNQLASSIIENIIVTCSGQQILNVQEFDIFHHIYMLSNEECQNPYMLYYNNEKITENPTITDGNGILSEFQKYPSKKYDMAIKERFNEDIKRSRQFYNYSNNDTHVGIGVYKDNKNINAKVLFKLNHLPCFSKMYFPLFAIKNSLQFQITFNKKENVFHKIKNTYTAQIPNYEIKDMEMICCMLQPTQQYIDRYMTEVVGKGQCKYNSEYTESNRQNIVGTSGTVISNVSLSRLRYSTHVLREYGDQTTYNNALVSNDYLPLKENYATRGSKWFSTWGDINSLAIRINGVYYPSTYQLQLNSQAHLLEFTLQNTNGLPGLKNRERFYLDQQIVAFSYLKDTNNPLFNVSGINTSFSNQTQLEYQTAQAFLPNTEIINQFTGQQIIDIAPNGQVTVHR